MSLLQLTSSDAIVKKENNFLHIYPENFRREKEKEFNKERPAVNRQIERTLNLLWQ